MARITLPKKYLNEIIDVINDAIILSDRSGKILLFNHTAEAFFGYSEEEVLGQSIGIVFLEDDQLYFLPNILKATLGRGSYEGEALLRKKDNGRIFGYLATSLYRGEDEEHNLIIFTVHNIDRFKSLEKAYFESIGLAGLGRLAEGIAHEIRNPIVSISGFANRLQSLVAEDSSAKRYLSIIGEEIDKLEKIVKNVEEFAHIPLPAYGFHKIIGLVQRAIREAEARAGRHKIQIALTYPDIEASEGLYADGELIVRSLTFMLHNAIDAIKESGRVEVRITLFGSGDRIAIEIADSGCGISEENLDAIFEPFFTTKPKRVGINLTTVRKIIEQHGGTISVTSTVGGGTSFRILLPRDRRRRERTGPI